MKAAAPPNISGAPMTDLNRQAEFIRHATAAIEAAKRDGGGISAEAVIAKLEAKLAEARKSKSGRVVRPVERRQCRPLMD